MVKFIYFRKLRFNVMVKRGVKSKKNQGFVVAVALIIVGLFILSAILAIAPKSSVTGMFVFEDKPDECLGYHGYYGDEICDDSRQDCGRHFIEGKSREECNECQTVYNGKIGFDKCG